VGIDFCRGAQAATSRGREDAMNLRYISFSLQKKKPPVNTLSPNVKTKGEGKS
jgi:hypothetical protein